MAIVPWLLLVIAIAVIVLQRYFDKGKLAKQYKKAWQEAKQDLINEETRHKKQMEELGEKLESAQSEIKILNGSINQTLNKASDAVAGDVDMSGLQ